MKINKIYFPIILALGVVAGIGLGMYFNFPNTLVPPQASLERENKIKLVMSYIDNQYVDAVDTDSLLNQTISELLRKLDPHSAFIAAQDVAESEEEVNGGFVGVGIEFRIFKDTLTVLKVMADGPAAKAGVLAGDRIYRANDNPMYGDSLHTNDVIAALKGEEDTEVYIEINRGQPRSYHALTITRGMVPIKSVSSQLMLDERTAYVRLDRFAQTTATEVKNAITTLRQQGAERLVFDLRDNPGGLLTMANAVSDQFLARGELIVFTQNRELDRVDYEASREGVFENGDLVILIDEGSASASEIVAGAVQDNDRGWIIGRRSFGKGLVQEEIPLPDGSKMRLTTRRYYTPSGRSIQKPFKDYDQRYLQNNGYHSSWEDSPQDSNATYYTTGGREVFGGGGILPDVAVAIDTNRDAIVVYHLINLANIQGQAFAYVDGNRKEFSAISQTEFEKSFEITQDVLDYFFKDNVGRLESLKPSAFELLKLRIKAYLAYELYNQSAYQKIYFKADPLINKALEVLNSDTLLLPKP